MQLSRTSTIRELVLLKTVSKTISGLVATHSAIIAQVRGEDNIMDWYFPRYLDDHGLNILVATVVLWLHFTSPLRIHHYCTLNLISAATDVLTFTCYRTWRSKPLKEVFAAAKINFHNGCSYAVTACDQDPPSSSNVTCYALQAGFSRERDVGSTSWFTGGMVWGFPGDNADPDQGLAAWLQADHAYFRISSGSDSMDYYVLSLQVLACFQIIFFHLVS